MAKQTIDIGSAPNDGTGDAARVGGDKINDNFTELYDGKSDISHTHTESDITDLAHTTDAADLVSGVLANARVQESNVTQHEAALTITESQVSDLGDYVEVAGDTMTGDLKVSGHAAIGDAAVDATKVLNIEGTMTPGVFGEADGLKFLAKLDDTAALASASGLRAEAESVSIGTANVLRAVFAGAYHKSAVGGSLLDLTGLFCDLQTLSGSTGAITTAAGVNINGAFNGVVPSQTIGLFVSDMGEVGASQSYGLKINKQTDATSAHAIFIAGDDPGADIVFGSGRDASIYWDGTDLVVDPTNVTSGKMLVEGGIKTDVIDAGGSAIAVTNGDVTILEGGAINFADADDSHRGSIAHDGTNLIINPQVAGAGNTVCTTDVNNAGGLYLENTNAGILSFTELGFTNDTGKIGQFLLFGSNFVAGSLYQDKMGLIAGALSQGLFFADNSGSDIRFYVGSTTGANEIARFESAGFGIRSARSLLMYNAANTYGVGFRAGNLAANVTWQLPTADGNAGEKLTTDGSTVLTWEAPKHRNLLEAADGSGGRSGSNVYLDLHNGMQQNANRGHPMSRGGSITAVSLTCNISTYTAGDDIQGEVRVNGVVVFTVAGGISSTGIINPAVYATQAKGVDTFVAGDLIQMSISTVSGSPVWGQPVMTVEIDLDE